MTFYPPTTLPPSPPYANLDAIVNGLCDRCLVITNSDTFPRSYKEQFFEVTMALIDFWERELEGVGDEHL